MPFVRSYSKAAQKQKTPLLDQDGQRFPEMEVVLIIWALGVTTHKPDLLFRSTYRLTVMLCNFSLSYVSL